MRTTSLSPLLRYWSLLLLSCALFLGSVKVAAATPYISEVMPAPTTGNEWVELHNPHDTSAWLMGWSLEDSAGALAPVPTFDETIIPAGGYIIFEVKNKLNNGGDSLTLKDMMGGVVDTLRYTSSTAAESWARQPSTAEGTFQLSTPTPGSANDAPPLPSSSPTPTPSPSPSPSLSPTPFPSPTPTATQSATLLLSTPSPLPAPTPTPAPSLTIHLSEITACPATGDEEWIELYNPQQQNVSLESWKLKDASGNTRTFSLTLARESFGLIEIPSALLNNAGDTLSILDQTGKEQIFLTLPACAQGQSTVFTSAGWQQTLTPTPQAENIFTVPAPASSPVLSLTASTTAGQTTTLSLPSTSSNTNLPSTPSGSNQEVFDSLSQFTSNLQQELLSESGENGDGGDSAASEQSLHVLPSLTINSQTDAIPSPTPTILGTSDESGDQPPQFGSGLPIWAQQLGIGILFSCALGCFAVSGYLCWQWYTEHHVEAAVEIL